MNLLKFTVSQFTLKNRILWSIHLCQNIVCLQEAQHQIRNQLVIVDKQIRNLRQRILRSDVSDVSSINQLRNFLKERHYFQRLHFSVRKSMIDLQFMTNENYPNGIRMLPNS